MYVHEGSKKIHGGDTVEAPLWYFDHKMLLRPKGGWNDVRAWTSIQGSSHLEGLFLPTGGLVCNWGFGILLPFTAARDIAAGSVTIICTAVRPNLNTSLLGLRDTAARHSLYDIAAGSVRLSMTQQPARDCGRIGKEQPGSIRSHCHGNNN